MAAGAVGGYFGARYAAAGHDVVFFARGAHRDAIASRGLEIRSKLGDLHLPKVDVHADPKGVAPVDIVLFAVKLWETEAAGAALKPIVAPATRVITVQNGVDSVERLAPILGPNVVVGGTAFIATVIGEPGVIRHDSPFARIRCGWLDGHEDDQVRAFVAAGKAAGIDIEQLATMQRERWQKFVFLVALSGSTALTRQPIGAILEDADGRELVRGLIEEVVAVGRAEGVALEPSSADDRYAAAAALPYGTKASMLHDLEHGNRIELDWLAGHVVALGRKHRIATPYNTAVYAALKRHRLGTKG